VEEVELAPDVCGNDVTALIVIIHLLAICSGGMRLKHRFCTALSRHPNANSRGAPSGGHHQAPVLPLTISVLCTQHWNGRALGCYPGQIPPFSHKPRSTNYPGYRVEETEWPIFHRGALQRRRRELEEESAFFGSMDGASKFVRGDAIAGLVILAVNIFGGIVIGATRHNMPLSEAGDVFTKLSVGDGLVSQIPGWRSRSGWNLKVA
jgi:FHIPEP family